ncbi:MAG TPA: hypothetical protein VK588_15260 [Chitinophagaceae bacterium]|nr:hypothetical protein [Chitinophagaceae bacterium]
MKKLFLIASVSAFLIACNNEKKAEAPKNTDLIGQNLKGKVQHYEEMGYAVDSTGKIGKEDSIINTQDYDEKGYQTVSSTKNPAGEVLTEGSSTHYEKGQTREFENKTKGKTTFKISIYLDSNGKYSYADSYDSSGKVTSTYRNLAENEYGEILKGIEYKPDSTMKSAFESNYDKDGHYTGGIGKDSTGKENYHSTLKLNDKGDPIEEATMTVTKDTTKNETVTYKYDTYDDKGNWTQRTTYNDKGKPTKILKRTYTYYKD